jgi:hypothetical protein
MATVAETVRVEALRAAPLDCWMVLSEDETRVLTSAATQEIVEASEQLEVQDPIILKTPPSWLPFA